MRTRTPRGPFWLVAGLAFLAAPPAPAEPPPAGQAPPLTLAAKGAVTPPAPPLPAEIVAALQEGRFADADSALGKLAAAPKGPDEAAYLALIRGTAQRLGGKADDARATLTAALKANPKGVWSAKLRLELAGLELAAGRHAEAEALARAEAETLLAPDRKDRLAGVYLDFAHRLLKPDSPVTPADPVAAHALLVQARGLAKGKALRARTLFEMAGALRQSGNLALAIEDYRTYVKENPDGPDRLEARFLLGDCTLVAGNPPLARLTWSDLARDLDGKADDKAAADVRARALYGVARTYGVPNPPDDTSLNLGVAALKRYLTAYPAHESSVRAAYDLAASYLARNKSDQALDALSRFLKGEGFQAEADAAKRARAELTMTATFEVGRVLQAQRKYDEAVAAYKGYLAKFPNGPQSADAQRAILDTRLQAAEEHVQRERYDEARAAWLAFVAENPLDGRVPELLYRVGAAYVSQKQYDQAVAAWQPLLGKFPGSGPAGHAQLDIASIEEEQKGDLEKAVDLYRKIAAEPWKSQAAGKVAQMEGRELGVQTPRKFRSGETARLEVSTRNLERLTFSAYKLNAEAYFRKKQGLEAVETLDIGLVAPDAEWSVEVPGYARYKRIEKDYELPKLEIPGVYVVKVGDEKNLQATTLVIGSDVDAVLKASSGQLLVFAQDMKTGKGRSGARVLVASNGSVIYEGKTGPDGVLLDTWPKPMGPGQSLEYLVLDGTHVAGTAADAPAAAARGLGPRAYLYTDRPAYRPGQQVELKGVVREVADGQYANVPKAVYRLEVADARGRQIVAKGVTLSDYGSFHESFPLDPAAPVGTYQVRLYQPGKSSFAGQFEVQAYKLEPLDLSFDLKKTVYLRGETVTADLVARYQYGAPAADREVVVILPDGRTLPGRTDAAGRFHVEFPTDGYAEEQVLTLAAQLPQDNVATAANVLIAVRAFVIQADMKRHVYLDGESFEVAVKTADPQGSPVGQSLTAALVKVTSEHGRNAEREAARKAFATDPKTGEARVALRADDPQGGTYVVRVSATDRFGTPIVADLPLTVSGKDDGEKLRILADRQSYKVGEEASVNLHNRAGKGTALLTWEGDRILTYKLVNLSEGNNPVGWAVDGAQFPNFTLNAARMAGDAFHEARLDVRVERDLRVTVTPVKPTVGPGQAVEVDLTTVDQLGRPVAAEVSLALIDRSLLRLYGDRLPPIGPFFYGQTRTGEFVTVATNGFTYDAETVPIASAVVDEADRVAAAAANRADLGGVLEEAKGQVALAAPAPVAAPQLQIRGMMGGMGGAMVDREQRDRLEAQDGAPMEDAARAGDKPAGMAKRKMGESRAPGFGFTDTKAAKAEASPRERFVETAYWNPAVVTGKDGKARVSFKAPAALSQYEFTARGTTGADTLVGQTTATLTVKKDFFVDLKVPATLTQGDKPRFVARVHHEGVKGKAELKLSLYSGGREQVYPKALELKDDGVDEVVFEPFEVFESENVRLTLDATADGGKADQLVAEVPVRPWGVQAVASASGTAEDDATVFVGLPAGRAYENAEMLVVVSPTLNRLLVELALGRDFYPLNDRAKGCIFPPPPLTTADRASDLLATASVLSYLRTTRAAAAAPEAERLTARARGLVSELTATQNDDGGWSWVGGPSEPQPGKAVRPSERLTSSRAFWALAAAEPLGLVTDPAALERGASYLSQEYARAQPGDHDSRAWILHALSTRGKASFEAANGLNRGRPGLSDPALAALALTFVNLDRATLAGEILDLLSQRGKAEAGTPGSKPGRFWGGSGPSPWSRGAAETTALVALAYAKVRPQAAELEQAVTWLLAHRAGFGWQPHKAVGPALAALSAYYGHAAAAEDRYDLVVTVNDAEVYRARVNGASEGAALLVPTKALKVGDRNRVRFDIDGRGHYGYSVSLTGFARDFAADQDRAGRTALIDRRVYLAAEPRFEGKALPTGFSATVGATPFENQISQVTVGGKARVVIDASRNVPGNLPEWERDFLVIEEHLPAGTTLIEGSLHTAAASHTLADGVLTLYFGPEQWPGTTQYEVYGYLPGDYRALPPSVRSAYEPGRSHLGPAGGLRVLPPGEATNDPYKPTPDELLARGRTLFDAGRLAEAAGPLEVLSQAYALTDAAAREAARMLLLIHIKEYDARKVVRDFEVVKEKAPDLVLTFDDLLVIGRAYRDIKEYERAYLVWAGVIDASYLEDARVGEALRQRGKRLEAVAYLTGLWRESPNTASIEADFFAMAQLVAGEAARALNDLPFRRAMSEAGISRPELLLQSIRMVQAFLAHSPKNPLADEASLALVGDFLELEDYAAVVKLSARFAKLYPRSTFLDSFQYSEALGEFHLGHYDRAVAVAEAIAKATYKDAAGADQPSPNKWQAVYILGQIFDARREPGKALDYYRQVADRFSDAADAVRSYTRKELKVPEVTVIRAPAPAAVAGARGLNAVPPRDPNAVAPAGPGAAKAEIKLDYRNIAEADVKVYPVDLMRLYLTRRNLDAVAGIDLAGITPLHEGTVALGKGADYDDKVRMLDLPLKKEGAYLVMVRGENLYASGIVLVTPLELEALEEPSGGRARVTVRDAATGAFVPKVQIKVIGSHNHAFISGETDLRGVFVAEGVLGEAAAVARKGADQYAFYRGTTPLGAPPVSPAPSAPPAVSENQAAPTQSLDQNLRMLNDSNQLRQIQRLENRYNAPPGPAPGGAAAGGFR